VREYEAEVWKEKGNTNFSYGNLMELSHLESQGINRNLTLVRFLGTDFEAVLVY
jgi:hypothetical protein